MSHRRTPPLEGRRFTERAMRVEYFAGTELAGEPVFTEDATRAWFVWLGPWEASVPPEFSARVTGSFVADETGAWRFSLVSAGRSRLLVDGTRRRRQLPSRRREAAIRSSDSAAPRSAPTCGSRPGREHAIVVEYANPGLPGLGGLAIGCEPPRPDDLFERAVALARARRRGRGRRRHLGGVGERGSRPLAT